MAAFPRHAMRNYLSACIPGPISTTEAPGWRDGQVVNGLAAKPGNDDDTGMDCETPEPGEQSPSVAPAITGQRIGNVIKPLSAAAIVIGIGFALLGGDFKRRTLLLLGTGLALLFLLPALTRAASRIKFLRLRVPGQLALLAVSVGFSGCLCEAILQIFFLANFFQIDRENSLYRYDKSLGWFTAQGDRRLGPA